MEKTLGGDRLGAGKKIKVDLHGWGRSTFNQSRIWRSTMAPGVLTPCFVEVGLNGTTFDIDINTLGHTIPTIAPLFGSFKLQVDMFACPIRLYQGLLHNNATKLGLEMNKVLLPTITLGEDENQKTNPSSLLNYLGIKGYNNKDNATNKFNAVPILAYYDIFKNYYSNKQEENAKVIKWSYYGENKIDFINVKLGSSIISFTENENQITFNTPLAVNTGTYLYITVSTEEEMKGIKEIFIETSSGDKFKADVNDRDPRNKEYIYLRYEHENTIAGYIDIEGNVMRIRLKSTRSITNISFKNPTARQSIEDFPLTNIDDARRIILANADLLNEVSINDNLNFLPYSANLTSSLIDIENPLMDVKLKDVSLQGLMLKTYQNDIFNCWLSTDYVDTINEISSIDVSEGLTIDAMILAKKVYNVLNRIAVSGGTYEDWQESVFGEIASRRTESPIYIGGTSAEITFEEVVSTAQSGNQPLATLGGKGIMTNKKGGNITYKCDEPCFIIGIASITPRVDYHQGNKWYMTELMNMDNFHKPGLDGIGFQNLIANHVVWSESSEKALAKQTAWINYQTAINEVFGEFALDEYDANSLHFMVLRRNYETDDSGDIKDFTSYIDPSKFNYAFANNELTAQNFWLQIGFNVTSRRKMAAYEIPNL